MPTARFPALLAGALGLATLLATTGCGSFFLWDLFSGDDDPAPTASADAGAAAAAAATTAAPSGDAATAAPAGPCTEGEACSTNATDAGVCGLDGTCAARLGDGAACAASWQCAGGLCAWDAMAGNGRCRSTANACKRTQPGCTDAPHSCCEGSRCRPAAFGAEAQCEVCRIPGLPCDTASAAACCSGTCSYGACQ